MFFRRLYFKAYISKNTIFLYAVSGPFPAFPTSSSPPPLLVLLILLSLTSSPSPSSTRCANSQAALPTSSHHVPQALPQEGKTLPPFPPFPCIDLHRNGGKEDRVLPPLPFPPPQVHALANAHAFVSCCLRPPTIHGLANTHHTALPAMPLLTCVPPHPCSGQCLPTVPGPMVPTLPGVAPPCLGAKGNAIQQPAHHCARDHLPGDHVD